MKLSIVIPAYNEKDSLPELLERIERTVSPLNMDYEVLVIDDGSTDGTFEALKSLKSRFPMLKAIRFRRNYGKSAALAEGFARATGDIVITMDADLQDDPAEIPNLIQKLEEGYDLVSGWKKRRQDPISKTIPSKIFNFVTAKLTGIPLHDFNCGLKAYRQEVIKNIEVYGELHRFLPVLAVWQGFLVTEIPVRHHPRKYGKTKFGISRFTNGFFDLLTVMFITRFRKKPLHFFGFLGLLSTFVGTLILLYLTILWFQGQGIGRRPLLFLGVLLVIVGVQFFSLGLIGEMVTSTLDQKIEYAIKEKIE